MMRSPHYFSVACRAPNGQIVIETEAIEKTWIGRQKWLKLAFLRGSLAIIDSMALGAKAMRFATNIQLAPEYQPVAEGEEAVAAEEGQNKRVQDVTIAGTLVISLLIAFTIFNYLPNLAAELIAGRMRIANPGHSDYRITNMIAEAIKVVLFFGYIWGIGQLPDIAEVFRYHGGEHKAINTLEANQPLEIEECLLQTRLHPRCGTSFAIVVLLVGFLVFTFLPRYPLGHPTYAVLDALMRLGIELCVLPLIAGISYETIRLAGKFRNTALVNTLFKPGLWSQLLTTREPEPKHVEVALAALRAVVKAEETGVIDRSEVTLPEASSVAS